jgi:hypothetical protein
VLVQFENSLAIFEADLLAIQRRKIPSYAASRRAEWFRERRGHYVGHWLKT